MFRGVVQYEMCTYTRRYFCDIYNESKMKQCILGLNRKISTIFMIFIVFPPFLRLKSSNFSLIHAMVHPHKYTDVHKKRLDEKAQ